MNKTRGINDLPDETLLEIFACLDVKDLVNNVQRVSSRWKGVLEDNRLWKRLTYHMAGGERIVYNMCTLKAAPKLQSLVANCTLSPALLETLMDNCPDLRKITFLFEQKMGHIHLKQMLSKCRDLEEFNVPTCIVDNEHNMKLLGQFRNIKKLGFWYNYQCPLDLRPIAIGCPMLQDVEISSHQYDVSDMEYFLECKRDQLQSLAIGCRFNSGSCTLPFLADFTALKSLYLYSYCRRKVAIGIHSLRHFTELVSFTWDRVGIADIYDVTSLFEDRNMALLTQLELTYYRNYDDTLANVIVENCPQLTKLHLKGCRNLTDESIKNFHMLKGLRSVDLYRSLITDTGIDYLSRCEYLNHLGIGHCSKLTGRGLNLILEFRFLNVLIMDYCDLSVVQLHLIPTKLNYLTQLTVHGCQNVDVEALIKVKSDMPALKMLPDYSYIILE